jgi:hypothetical protein
MSSSSNTLATEITENTEKIFDETTPILTFPLRGKGIFFVPLEGRQAFLPSP